jgi:RNA polymerase sigma-70 factor (ECF subfamily)
MAIDKARAEALFKTFGPAIFRRCTRLLKDGSEAEDATQEVFLKVCRYLDRLKPGESGLPWVFQIATSVCLNRLRGQARFDRAALKLTSAEPVSLSAALEDREQARMLLSHFDERTGLIAAYHLIAGMTQDEIAAALGVTRRTVYTHLTKFLARAKELA